MKLEKSVPLILVGFSVKHEELQVRKHKATESRGKKGWAAWPGRRAESEPVLGKQESLLEQV